MQYSQYLSSSTTMFASFCTGMLHIWVIAQRPLTHPNHRNIYESAEAQYANDKNHLSHNYNIYRSLKLIYTCLLLFFLIWLEETWRVTFKTPTLFGDKHHYCQRVPNYNRTMLGLCMVKQSISKWLYTHSHVHPRVSCLYLVTYMLSPSVPHLSGHESPGCL